MSLKIRLVGRANSGLHAKLRARGFTLGEDSPDLILAYGGDGTLIGAERLFPGIPKLGLRHDDACIKCPRHADEVVLDKLARGELEEHQLLRIEGKRGTTRVVAMNDIILRNADARAAVRFVVSLNGEPVTEELIGDGLVICTPFGSSAYFRSITRTVTRAGIGVAFNNCTDLLNHLVIAEHEELEVEMTRGPATLAADNDRTVYTVHTGERVAVRRAARRARVLAVDTLRCSACRYIHAPRRRY